LTDNASDPLNAPHIYLSDLFPDTEVRGWTDSAAMIEAGGLDIVDVTATVSAHHPAALQAFGKGMHVMVQKPIAGTIAEANDMVHAADQAGRALGVMENVYYEPQVMLKSWIVERGFLGQIQMVIATFLGTHQWSPDRVVADTPWRHRREEAGGGISVDLGVHFFQHLRRVCGPIKSVYGQTRTFEPVRYVRDKAGVTSGQVEADVDDTMFCQLELEEGGIGHLSASWAGHGPPTSLPGGFIIYGSKGSIHGDQVYLDGQQPVSLEDFWNEHGTDEDREALFPLGLRNSFALIYLDFFRAIEEGRKPAYDGLEGLKDLAWSFAVLQSSEQGRSVTLQEMLA
ncbi:MAG: Gfo/Idh/MocA family oxidoreductase, partial [Chloroflexota bacterium]|nr:Gfo/Idh/MocA family oxidoreductase [Chloroflexota bacterium]